MFRPPPRSHFGKLRRKWKFKKKICQKNISAVKCADLKNKNQKMKTKFWKKFVARVLIFAMLMPHSAAFLVLANEIENAIETEEIAQLKKVIPTLTETHDEKRQKKIEEKVEEKVGKNLKSEINQIETAEIVDAIEELKNDGEIAVLENARGEKEEIDPTLQSNNAGALFAKKTPYKAQIPEKAAESAVVIGDNLNSDGDKIKNESEEKVLKDETPKVVEEVRYFSIDAQNVSAITNGNKALFKNIWENVDLLLTTLENGIKEDIILKNSNAALNYDYVVETVGLELKMKSDGGFYFIDEKGNEKFFTPPPVLTDVDGTVVQNESVRYEILTEEDLQRTELLKMKAAVEEAGVLVEENTEKENKNSGSSIVAPENSSESAKTESENASSNQDQNEESEESSTNEDSEVENFMDDVTSEDENDNQNDLENLETQEDDEDSQTEIENSADNSTNENEIDNQNEVDE